MRSRLIRIGNSRGVRLPKAILEQIGATEDLDVSVERGAIVIRPAKRPREGWAESIEKLGVAKPELFLDFPNRFDEEEWEWK